VYTIVFVANYVVQLKEGPTTTIELSPFWRHVKFHVPREVLPRLIELSEIQEDSKTKVWEIVFFKPISMNKINLTLFNHCYFPSNVAHRLNDNPITCFGPFLHKKF